MAVGCWQLAIGGWRLVVRTVIYGIFGFSGFVSWQPSVISDSTQRLKAWASAS